MNHRKHSLIFSIVTIVSIIIVFTFSSQDALVSYGVSGRVLLWLESHGIVMREYALRKLAHIFIYFLLGASSTALFTSLIQKTYVWKLTFGMCSGIVFSCICAVIDEWNQSHITGRTGIYSDIRYDAIGFVIGSLLVMLGMMCWYCYYNRGE